MNHYNLNESLYLIIINIQNSSDTDKDSPLKNAQIVIFRKNEGFFYDGTSLKLHLFKTSKHSPEFPLASTITRAARFGSIITIIVDFFFSP